MSYIVAYLDQWLGKKTAAAIRRRREKEEPVGSGVE